MSNLVDSCGFLGWDSSQSSVSDFAASGSDFAASSGECAVSKHLDEKEEKKSADNAQVDSNPNEESAKNAKDDLNRNGESSANDEESKHLAESWRIEDYEGDPETAGSNIDQSNKTSTGTIKLGVGIVLSEQLRRLSSHVTASSASDKDEHIKTDEVKRALLRGRVSADSLPPSANSQIKKGGSRRRSSAFKTFFDRKARSSEELGDDYYARPAIRINREDGDVDIGELRRELCKAGKNHEKPNDATNRLKMGFF